MNNKSTITITVDEYTRLKDIETRFSIIKEQMAHAEYCPIHTQIILGINGMEFLQKELHVPEFMQKQEIENE